MKYTITRTILAISFIFLSLGVGAQALKQNPALIKKRLGNGLTYYIYPNQTPKGEAVYRLFIKSGSVFETESQKGLAHFLEHMAFNGSENFPGESLIGFLESKGAKFGADLNAHTSYNETVYKLQLPSHSQSMVDSTLMILSDWGGRLLLDGAKIEKERGVIMSEWLSKTGPKQEVQNALLYELLNNSRFSERIVIGDTAVIKNFAHQELRDYYNQWYNPALMAVAVVGDIDAKKVEKKIKTLFGSLKSYPIKGGVPTYTIEGYDDLQVKTVTHESLDKIELVGVQILPNLPAVKTEKDYPEYLERVILNRLFKERMSALSFGKVSYKKGSIGISGFLNTSSIILSSVELVPNKIEEGMNEFTTNLEQIYRHGFITLEIEKVKRNYLAALKRSSDSQLPVTSINLMGEIYSDFYAGNKVITQKEEYELAKRHLAKIDSSSIANYLNKTIDWSKSHFILSAFDKASKELPSNESVKAMILGLKNKNIPAYAKVVNVPDELLSAQPIAGKIVERGYISDIDTHTFTLSNGAKVVFKPTDVDKNKIILTGFRKGGLYAMDSLDYVSGMYAKNVIGLSGAGALSRDELSYYLTGNTASMTFFIEKSRTGLGGKANKEDMQTMFELLYLKWTEPRVDTATFNLIKSKAVESYKTKNKTASEKFYLELGDILREQNYTTRELNDTIVEDELKLERLVPLYTESFGGAEDFTFIIIGDCDQKELEGYIESYLAALPSGKPNTEYNYDTSVKGENNFELIRYNGESPRAIVSLVYQQNKITERLRDESLKDDMLKSVLRSKLLKALREEMGMVYSVGVSASSTQIPQMLSRQTISFTTAAENAEILVNRTLKEIEQMVANPSSFESELADVKMNLIKDMNLNRQKNSFWSGYIRNSLFNGETEWNYIADYDKIVNAVSPAELASVIKEKMLDNRMMVKAILYPQGYEVENKNTDN